IGTQREFFHDDFRAQAHGGRHELRQPRIAGLQVFRQRRCSQKGKDLGGLTDGEKVLAVDGKKGKHIVGARVEVPVFLAVELDGRFELVSEVVEVTLHSLSRHRQHFRERRRVGEPTFLDLVVDRLEAAPERPIFKGSGSSHLLARLLSRVRTQSDWECDLKDRVAKKGRRRRGEHVETGLILAESVAVERRVTPPSVSVAWRHETSVPPSPHLTATWPARDALALDLLMAKRRMTLLELLWLLQGGSMADSSPVFLVVGLVMLFLIALTDDDDLPGPRRCFARAGGQLYRPAARANSLF